MNDWPYHQYLFFEVDKGFLGLSKSEQLKLKNYFLDWLQRYQSVEFVPYLTLGFKPGTTFMLWCRSHDPQAFQQFLRDLGRLKIGQWLTLRHSLFGIIRQSQYSRGPKRAEQVILANERLPYLIVYPFTKTTAWHQLDNSERGAMMGEHIVTGIKHTQVRQCLLYAYGVDDHEFVLSYETPSLEQFQDLIMELRGTAGRSYTLNDLPIFTCVYKPVDELMDFIA